jgi:hypothetical protein
MELLATRFLGTVSIAALIGLVYSSIQAGAEDRCDGVLMATNAISPSPGPRPANGFPIG